MQTFYYDYVTPYENAITVYTVTHDFLSPQEKHGLIFVDLFMLFYVYDYFTCTEVFATQLLLLTVEDRRRQWVS